jgi:hypothetical protein
MEKFAKLFDLEEGQVLFEKQYDVDENIYQMKATTVIADTKCDIVFPYENEQERDEAFDEKASLYGAQLVRKELESIWDEKE